MSEIIRAIADVLPPADIPQEPNWMLICIILGIMGILAIIFMMPSKSEPMLDEEDESDKSLTGEKREALPSEGQVEEKKEKLSLAEIKKEKRAAVSEDMSKEELRELRRERRAATQTEKAVSGRASEETAKAASEPVKAEAAKAADESDAPERASRPETAAAEPEKSEHSEAEEALKAAEEAARVAAEEAEAAAKALEEAEQAAREARKAAEAAAEKARDIEKLIDEDIVSDAEADSSDVFSSLFGGDGPSLGFEDVAEKNEEAPAEATFFPTLGSALIPLDQLSKAADEEEASIDPFEELTKRMAAKAEKKTLK